MIDKRPWNSYDVRMNLVAHVRRSKGLTQVQLAELMGIPPYRLSELELRPLPARVYRLKGLAKALGVSIDALIGEERPTLGCDRVDKP